MSGRELTYHGCAAMRAAGDEDGRTSVHLASPDGGPWRLIIGAGDGLYAFAVVTYCPWCGKRLDGQREEGC